MNLKEFCEKHTIAEPTVEAVAVALAAEFHGEGRGPLIEAFETDVNWIGSSWCGRDPSVGIFSGYYEEIESTEPWAQKVLDVLSQRSPRVHTSIFENIIESVTAERMERR